jgi:hypothetical protein
MRRWLSSLFGRGSVPASTQQSLLEPDDPFPVARLEELIRSPGRPHYAVLICLAHSVPLDDFVTLVHCPSLVGSAIREGEIKHSTARTKDLLSNATFTFSPTQVSSFLEGGSIEQTIFFLRKEANREDPAPAHRFLIGRAKSNHIRIVDFAISRAHAVIERTAEGYTIHDNNSRNGTKINGRPVYSTPELLSDGDTVSLGRYEFSFLLPAALYERLKSIESPL